MTDKSRLFENRAQLSDDLASYVRELIMSGHLKPGEHVRIDHMAKELGISPTPVREGLLALRGEGFVQLEPRRGFVVSPLSRQDVADLFMVTANVAGELAARAAPAIEPQQLDDLAIFQKSLEDAHIANDPDTFETFNFQFHRAINMCAASPKLSWILDTIVQYAPQHIYAATAEQREAIIEDHRAIYAALKSSSPETAREAMSQHMHRTGRLLIARLDHLWHVDEQQDAEVVADSSSAEGHVTGRVAATGGFRSKN
jgi:DNA-binding GntR family transcriptional regulator